MTPAADRPSAAAIWLGAARLKTLPAAVAPVLLGTALAAADGVLHILAALCALASAVLIQVGTNYANDAEDFVRGADTAARVGPKRATAEGWVTAAQMRRAAALAFSAAFLAGLFLVWRGGVPVLALGLVAIASGYAYTKGRFALAFGAAFLSSLFLVWRGGLPVLALGLVAIASGYAYTKGRFALAYTGLADVFVLAFFGPVAVGGTYFVQALALPPYVLAAGLGPGALATAILVANNVRDAEQDRAADKRTLVVRFGRRFGIWLYGTCFGLAFVAPLLTLALSDQHALLGPAMAVAAIGGVALVPALRAAHGAAAGPILGQTAAALLVYSLAFAGGWLLA